ncbi:MAG: hypothetical protein AAF485_05550 [Chloroflexota bacterium]
MIRPLWQLLLDLASPETKDQLTCAECFSLLELLFDLTENDLDQEDKTIVENRRLIASAHLERRIDCQDYYLQRLHEFEIIVTQQHHSD